MAITAPAPRVLADLVPSTVVRQIALIVGGAAFIGLSAQIAFYLPWNPAVPVTLQTFAVVLGAAALGSWRGTAATALYALLGGLGHLRHRCHVAEVLDQRSVVRRGVRVGLRRQGLPCRRCHQDSRCRWAAAVDVASGQALQQVGRLLNPEHEVPRRPLLSWSPGEGKLICLRSRPAICLA